MLNIHVRKRQGDFTIDAGFSVGDAGVTALFGTSGAGKTSIVNMVAGLSKPDSGRIVLNGRSLFDSEQGINEPPERRRVGYVFQDARLFPHLSVKANLTYGMRLVPHTERYVNFDEVVRLLGIEALLDRRPARLSGGEKQRVAIGRAFLCSPALLLMDEPLASLDQSRKSEVLPFISQLSTCFSTPILYVSHILDEIEELADNLVLIDKGAVVAAGPFDQLKTSRELAELMGKTGVRRGMPSRGLKIAS
ncbi:MAG: molybdenum ABC transporter ATP-binding protein [Desulfatibacillum sp.]|nr:molybdenum ABC transporter ATP-binding protein [Desulfatibacillum sp.]